MSTTTTRTALAGLAVTSLALLLGACGSSGTGTAASTPSSSPSMSMSMPMSSSPSSPSSSPSTSPSAKAAAMITIKDFKYTLTGTITAGSMVMVMNNDTEAHTVTADKGGFDVKVDPGASVMFAAPKTAGTYAYHCTYHSNMHGSLKVG